MDARLIIDPGLPGRKNMERDEALLTHGVPCLRFYQWDQPCLSVGYFQDIKRDIDTDYLTAHGIDLVRRPTGGRAVLHDKELTYSLVLPASFLPSGVIPSYKKIAAVFAAALRSLGFEPELRGPEGRPDKLGICFGTASAYEIALAGRKVLGSAQVTRNNTLLQHGSLLLEVDCERLARCMKGPSALPATELQKRMCGLYEFKQIDIRLIMESVIAAFQNLLDLQFKPH